MFKWGRDVRWQLVRPFIFVISLGIFAVFGFQLAVSRITDPKNFQGCRAMSTSGQPDITETLAFFEDRSLTPLHYTAMTLSADELKVLGASTEIKWIEVDLSDQQLIAHQGDKIFLKAAISSGLWNKTPVGEYQIWYKIASTKMEGGSRLNHTYYYLPNVPYAMFFNGDYGIHGTYWHNSFGQPRSHGCVNAPTSVAEKLFYWTDPKLPEDKRSVRSSLENPGTKVIVHE